MELARKIVENGHAARKLSGIQVRQPLVKITVVHSTKALDDDILQLIKDELNVKKVAWKVEVGKAEPEVDLDTEITPDLEEEGKTRELARQIQEERKRLKTPLDAIINVTTPWLPQEAENLEWLKKRTLTRELKKGEKLVVKEVSR
ncbi:MAG: hypothetical protein HY377_02525 [Candidatus Blackburnbacteria bacterium]|nr:hypothetical protein [Candidatus Blackburnbacteria bacterium]